MVRNCEHREGVFHSRGSEESSKGVQGQQDRWWGHRGMHQSTEHTAKPKFLMRFSLIHFWLI